jgi:hypothetical protein
MKSPTAEEPAMTTMGKTLFVILGLGALFGVTLALRTERDTPHKPVQLTPAQVAEMQPAPKAPEPAKATPPAPAPQGEVADPLDFEAEDGSGS